MAIHLARFGIGEQLRCSAVVRAAAQSHSSMESAARAVCRSLFDVLRVDADDDAERACALVRCYKTHPYGALPADLQRFARTQLDARARPRAAMRCLTLLASAGAAPEWNSRHESRGHKAIPLPSPELVEKAPMIAQLVRDFGLELAEIVEPAAEPPADVVRDRRGKNYGVFHVEQALGSAHIPAQAEFVRRHGVRSVIGFGGSLATGELFAVILFARVPVAREAADRFRAVALDVKTAFFPFAEDEVFDRWPGAAEAETSAGLAAT